MMFVLIVLAILDVAVIFPGKNDSLRIDDLQFSGNKPGITKFLLGDLAHAAAGTQIGAPGDGAGGHIVIAGDLQSFHVIAILNDANTLVIVPRIVADPLS